MASDGAESVVSETAYLTTAEGAVNYIGAALGAPELIWSIGGDGNWHPVSDEVSEYKNSVRGGDLELGEKSWLETVVRGPGVVRFDRTRHSEIIDTIYLNGEKPGYYYDDYLVLEEFREYAIRFEIERTDFQDAGGFLYIHDFHIDRSPVIVKPLASQFLGVEDESVQFEVGVASDSEVRYQWFCDEAELEGEVGSTLTLNADEIDGDRIYYVDIINKNGFVRSHPQSVSTNQDYNERLGLDGLVWEVEGPAEIGLGIVSFQGGEQSYIETTIEGPLKASLSFTFFSVDPDVVFTVDGEEVPQVFESIDLPLS